MKFQFPNLIEDSYDNISCMGQIIEISSNYCSQIMILSCAEWGNYFETIIINYTDGFSINIPFEVSDWAMKNQASHEVVAWDGVCIKIGDYKGVAYIYAQGHLLSHNGFISTIILPNCSNIHIFAISLKQLIDGISPT